MNLILPIVNNRFNPLFITGLVLSLFFIISACGGGSAGNPATGNTRTGLPAPIITAITPTAGAVGTTVRIEGLLFATNTGQNSVQFNGISAAIVSANDKIIVVTVPAGATTGKIQITTVNGSSNSNTVFNVLNDTTTPGLAWTTRLNGVRGLANSVAFNGLTTVIVGDGIYRSSNNRVWQDQNSALGASDVIWDGQQFVAVGGASSVHTSIDGYIWNSQSTFGAPDLFALVKSNTHWVAVGESGVIRTSTDTKTWITQTTPTTETLTEVAWNGTTLVAMGRNGIVLTSNDSINWTLRVAAGITDTFNSLGANSSLFVASTFPKVNSDFRIVTSADGINWTVQATGLGSFSDIIYANNIWLAVGQYKVATSPDANIWRVTSNGANNNIGLLNSVIYNGSEYLALGNTGYSTSGIYRSRDALNWQLLSSDQRLQTITRSPIDGRLVASGISEVTLTSIDNGNTWQHSGGFNNFVGYLFTEVEWSTLLNTFIASVKEAAGSGIYTSSDGLNWTRLTTSAGSRGLASSASLLLNMGGGTNGGTISTSTDGLTWTTRANPASQTLIDAIWTGSQFLAFGSVGNVVTSPDGIIWTKRNTAVSATLNAAVATPSLLVIVGTGGTILTSSDAGVNWTTQNSTTNYDLNAIAWTGSEMVAVGSNGRAIRSLDGITWQEQTTPYNTVFFQADSYHLNGLVWTGGTNGRLIAVGDRGLITTSP